MFCLLVEAQPQRVSDRTQQSMALPIGQTLGGGAVDGGDDVTLSHTLLTRLAAGVHLKSEDTLSNKSKKDKRTGGELKRERERDSLAYRMEAEAPKSLGVCWGFARYPAILDDNSWDFPSRADPKTDIAANGLLSLYNLYVYGSEDNIMECQRQSLHRRKYIIMGSSIPAVFYRM